SRSSSGVLSSEPRWTSSRTTSGRAAATALSASSMLAASFTSKPSSSRLTRQSMRRDGSSSTRSTLGEVSTEGDASPSVGDTICGLTPRTGTAQGYAVAMGELWPGLARTLSRLDLLAGEPDALDDGGSLYALRRLQYGLHV